MAQGTDPFRPSARHGRALADALRLKLASSFAYLAEACRPHVLLDEHAIAAKIAEIEAAGRVRPEIFIIHRACARAAVNGDLPGIAEAFADLCAVSIAAPPGIVARGWRDASFSPAEAERYEFAFGAEGDTPVALIPAAPEIYAESARALKRAEDALRRADPEFAGEVEALVKDVVLADGRIGDTQTFDGISSFTATGALVLNAAENRTTAGMLATLVHEAAHGLLFAEDEGRPLVENPLEERYPSPLRVDPRPMNGVYHATFVCARMTYGLDRVLAHGTLSGADREEAATLLARMRTGFAAGHATVRAHARPTAIGARLMNAAAAYMA